MIQVHLEINETIWSNMNQDNFVTCWNPRLTYLEMIIRFRAHFLISLRHVDAFPSFVFVFQKGVCARECWNKEETPRMNPKVLPDNWLASLSVTRNMNESSIKAVSVLRHCSKDPEQGSFLFVRAAPRCEGAGNAGCPAWSVGCGRQSRGTRPRWMSGQHLFHLLAGSYQQKMLPHTHWTGEDLREKGNSLQSLRKHVVFCLSCKRKLGSPSGRAICISQSSQDSFCCVCWYLFVLVVGRYTLWHRAVPTKIFNAVTKIPVTLFYIVNNNNNMFHIFWKAVKVERFHIKKRKKLNNSRISVHVILESLNCSCLDALMFTSNIFPKICYQFDAASTCSCFCWYFM